MGKRTGRHPHNALDVKTVAALTRKRVAGRHFDGGGLHLLVKPNGSASWVLRVSSGGRRKDYGLGGSESVSLADAREGARTLRAVTKAGGDPGEAKRRAGAIPNFEQIAHAVHAEHIGSWKNPKHAAQWITTLETYVFPQLGKTRIDLIGVPEVLRVLTPIWLSKAETARRVRQRLRVVLDYARALGLRSGENPVGPILRQALPKQSTPVRHHPALPYGDLPAFYGSLSDPAVGGEVVRLALRFLILTACRSAEVRGARHNEFDLRLAMWTIPAERMKAKREHRVPLAPEALALVRRAMEFSTDSDLLFPGQKRGRPLSDMTLLKLMRRAGKEAVPSWLPLDLPGLGWRDHDLPLRSCRDGTGSHHRIEGGKSLRAR